jgi:hypothetical protein
MTVLVVAKRLVSSFTPLALNVSKLSAELIIIVIVCLNV